MTVSRSSCCFDQYRNLIGSLLGLFLDGNFTVAAVDLYLLAAGYLPVGQFALSFALETEYF